jgi:hypothetical protein
MDGGFVFSKPRGDKGPTPGRHESDARDRCFFGTSERPKVCLVQGCARGKGGNKLDTRLLIRQQLQDV